MGDPGGFMNKKEVIVWGGICLALLYTVAALSFLAFATRPHVPYDPPCRTVGHLEVPCE